MKHDQLSSKNFSPHQPPKPTDNTVGKYNDIGAGSMMPKSGVGAKNTLEKTSHARFKSMIKGKKGIS
jgi:hypothetical protein